MSTEMSQNTRVVFHYITQDGRCYYCKRAFLLEDKTIRPLNIDHKQPTSRGGKNTTENTALVCVECNNAKSNMTEEEYNDILPKILSGEITRKDVLKYAEYRKLKSIFEPK